jgi:hypothetical protein
MSSINGDKSRFNRVRKQRIFQRQRNRILVHGLITAGGQTPHAAAKAPLSTPPASKTDIQP